MEQCTEGGYEGACGCGFEVTGQIPMDQSKLHVFQKSTVIFLDFLFSDCILTDVIGRSVLIRLSGNLVILVS